VERGAQNAHLEGERLPRFHTNSMGEREGSTMQFTIREGGKGKSLSQIGQEKQIKGGQWAIEKKKKKKNPV